MNQFECVQSIDDLGVTIIENAFINHYMPKARGDYVKVYLFGLKFCSCAHHPPTNDQIAQALRLTEGDVINAWKYWDNEGIITFTQQGDDCVIEYHKISVKLFINGESGKPKKKIKKESKNNHITQMNKDIEDALGRPLSHKELDMFLNWIEEYQFTPQTIVLIILDCINREKRGVNYWQSMAQAFFAQGIKTYDQAQQFLQSRELRWGHYREVLNYLGFYRLPTKPEKSYIDRWLDEQHFTMDQIKAACEETVKTNRPSIKYVDVVLTNQSTDPAKSKTTRKKNVAMDHAHQYDMDQIEDLLFGDQESNG